MVIGTVTLSVRAKYPVNGSSDRKQNVFEAGDGTIRVSNRGAIEDLLTYEIPNIPRTEFDDLKAFLESESGANYRGNVFAITDDWSQSYNVRWWNPPLKFVQQIGRLYSISISFRLEN